MSTKHVYAKVARTLARLSAMPAYCEYLLINFVDICVSELWIFVDQNCVYAYIYIYIYIYTYIIVVYCVALANNTVLTIILHTRTPFAQVCLEVSVIRVRQNARVQTVAVTYVTYIGVPVTFTEPISNQEPINIIW